MQFTHFDGSLTPVPSIHDALMVLDRKDDYRNPVHKQTTGRDENVLIAKGDPDTGRVTLSETTTVVGEARNYDVLFEDTSSDYRGSFRSTTVIEDEKVIDGDDKPRDWMETPHGFYREDVTRFFHAKVLNAFRIDGRLSVGSVRIFSDAQGVTAACVKCKAQLSLDYDENLYGLGYDLDLLEEFTRRVILHGTDHRSAKVPPYHWSPKVSEYTNPSSNIDAVLSGFRDLTVHFPEAECSCASHR